MKEVSETEIKKMLYKEYGLKSVRLVQLHGFFDQNYKISTHSKNYFLKIYREDPKSVVKFQIDFMEKCQVAGLPVAKIIPTAKGQDHAMVKNFPALLQEFLPGKHFSKLSKSSPLFKHAGSVLGKIHQLTAAQTFVGKTRKLYPWDQAQFNKVIFLYKKALPDLAPNLVRLILQVFAEWRSRQSELKKLKQGIIHGDYHASNILGMGNKITAVTDFADANYSWYAGDLAIALAHLVFWSKGIKTETAAKAFLSGYTKYFPFSEQEIKCLPLLMKMRAVTVAVAGTLHFKESKKKLSRDWYRDQAKLIEYFS